MRVAHATGELRGHRCLVMGVVNRTPDSFSGEGRMALGDCLDHAHRLLAEGADVLDVGGVKGGPGPEVAEAEELARVLPIVEGLAGRVGTPMSVETGRAGVARRVIGAGASMINDVTGLRDPGLAGVCADTGAALVLMHHGGQLRGRPRNPRYGDVVTDIVGNWSALAAVAASAGVPEESIVVDPGLDFGKTTFHSLEVMRRLEELVSAARWPVLVASSRKDVVGESLGLPPDQRLEGSLALVALSVLGGASIVRVHDVAASVRTVTMVEAVMGRVGPRAPVRGLWE